MQHSHSSQQKYQNFFFDFDGTLADSRLNITNSCNFALEKLQLSPRLPEEIYPLIGKLNLDEIFLFFYPDLSLNERTQLSADFRAYQKLHAQEEIVLFPGVEETIQELVAREKNLAIITTKHVATISHLMKLFSLDQYFFCLFGSELTEYAKPDGQCVEYVVSRLSAPVSLNKCVMVGDSTVDCQTAENGGIDMIGVSHGTDSEAVLLENGAKVVLHSFSDLLQFV